MAYDKNERGGWSYRKDEHSKPQEEPAVEESVAEESVAEDPVEDSSIEVEEEEEEAENPEEEERRLQRQSRIAQLFLVFGSIAIVVILANFFILVYQHKQKNTRYLTKEYLEQLLVPVPPDSTQSVLPQSNKQQPTRLQSSEEPEVIENSPWPGSGTDYSPFLISTVQDLYTLAQLTSLRENGRISIANSNDSARFFCKAYYRLENDITFSVSDTLPRIGWSAKHPFMGVFDGAGHTICGLNYDDMAHARSQRGAKNPVGLFGYLYGAYIHDLRLTDLNYRTISLKVGGLVAVATNSSIENCRVTGRIFSRQHGATVGGVLGWSISSTVELCRANIDMTIGRHAAFVGGVVAYMQERSRLFDSQSEGRIDAHYINDSGETRSEWLLENLKAGGVLGVQREGCEIRNCSSQVSIKCHGQTDKNWTDKVVGYITERDNPQVAKKAH